MEVSNIIKILDDVAVDPSSTTEADKRSLLQTCSRLVSALEPIDKNFMELLFAPLRPICLRIAIDIRLFDACTPGLDVTLKELSSVTKCEALLIKRIMRMLISMNIFSEVEQDVFRPTQAAALYKYESPIAQIIIYTTMNLIQLVKLPDYFAERGYQSPTNSIDCPFQYAIGTTLHSFDWVATNPIAQHSFNVSMTVRTQRSVDSKWFEVYPIERLIKEEPVQDVFLVDVGGGIGHQTTDFKKHHPGVRGRLIVQDIASVIESIENLPAGIEAMAADFFKPQPVRGAKVYFLAHVLHDWPDKEAKAILRHVHDAMEPRSVVLLSETIMPERGASFVAAGMDLTMMAAYASLERTEEQFREILDEVGLRLVEVWSEQKSEKSDASMLGQSILEARLK
ncbi:S-adenosyl-L-methionine-dependent methyltransferase [Polyplosphaeria fusca]|uniref:S-adenosyl-L-methionine-dependent methyltransferase n=1 Tax=Polyplosphaeria fusca TaxID=682080 RepID=A0A9P4R224_9PLEO|nr:S-adenosyl-L-methionine-dependent methyltransferase [Polyplosphaeria fusca]